MGLVLVRLNDAVYAESFKAELAEGLQLFAMKRTQLLLIY